MAAIGTTWVWTTPRVCKTGSRQGTDLDLGWTAVIVQLSRDLFRLPSHPHTRLQHAAAQVELFVALCKALPQLGALRSLELEGLSKAFEKVTMNACLCRLEKQSLRKRTNSVHDTCMCSVEG